MFLLLAPALALAYDSDPQGLVLSDDVDVFAAADYDSGPLPSGSPLWVRVYVSSDGGASTSMDATSTLTWPEALTHQIQAVPNTGAFGLLTDITMGAEVGFDIFGYTGTIPVWSQNLTMYGDTSFDGLLLPDSVTPRVGVDTKGAGIPTINYTFSVYTGVDIVFTLDVFPEASASFAGEKIMTDDGLTTNALLGEKTTETFDVHEDDPGELSLESTYSGWIDADLDIGFQPTVQICVIVVGCFDVARFDIPVPLVTAHQLREFTPADYSHPLPSLLPPITNHDFGDVDAGTTNNLEIALKNVGLLDLEGTAAIEGDATFTVFPEYFSASADATDGLVVTYSPIEAGEQTAKLVLTSNDPLRPRIEIPLIGNAADPDHDIPGETVTETVKTCGCSSPGSLAPWPALLLGLLLVRRRRHS
jgi:MYXO-CTERM domain-containing protein